MEDLTVIVSHNITVERYQFQHAFQPFSFKTASFRNKHLKFRTLTAADSRENGRRYGFLFADFEEVTDNLVTSIHTDIVVIAYLSVFHLNNL